MYTLGYILKTDKDIENAIHYRFVVSITQNGEHYGNHCIKSYNNETITLVNGKCFDKHCSFKVVSYAAFYEPSKIVLN